MLDERLIALSDHVEAGGSSPEISFHMGNGVVVQGVVVPEREFMAVTRQSLGNSSAARKTGWFGRAPSDLEEQVRSGIDAQLAGVTVRQARADGSAAVLHVAPARVIPLMGASLTIPALRLNLSFVQAWWLGVVQVHEMKFSGGGVGVGVSF